ncbi:MAG: DHHA1 domain-containing protein [Candidatus Omnitrophota bacterium]|jgi:nanoRNase/pAp phosphatase (c-di-AMP/oligoRNAs hydrolase)
MACSQSGTELMTKIGKELVSRNARKLLKFMSERREAISPLLILTHDYPDPDALASAFALQFLAQKGFGIEARIVYGGIVGRMENRAMVRLLKIPAHKIRPRDFRKFSAVALVDTQPDFKNNPFPGGRKAAIVIDQHVSVSKPAADFSIIDPECGATSVILAQALLVSHSDIPANVATALAYGIQSDTLNLYRAGQPHISRTYLDMLLRCDLRSLAQIQNPPRSRRFFSTLSKAIHRAMIRRQLIVSHLGDVENPDLIAQAADFLLTYKGLRWSFVTGRYKGRLHVSLRMTNPNAEAGEILRDIFQNRGDAGGHDSIAGGSLKVAAGADEALWLQAEAALVEKLSKRLRIPSKSEFYFPFRKT